MLGGVSFSHYQLVNNFNSLNMKMSGIQAQVELLTAANSKLQLQVLKNATVKSSTQSSFEPCAFFAIRRRYVLR